MKFKTLKKIVLSAVLTLSLSTKAIAIDNIKIANWNLQAFGKTKSSNQELLQNYASILCNYDIIFVQEIRDKEQKAFPKLCNLLLEYNYIASSRAGRTQSKEQCGVIYKKDIKIEDFKDFNPDPDDRWERPPIKLTFNIENYKLTAYNLHTKPEDTTKEINDLEKVVENQGNVIVLGDLNADCFYYNASDANDFDSWHWIINDNEDTTASSTNCAYDRIILNDDVYKEYLNDGICNQITKKLSDHYLVWIELQTHSPADLNKDGIVNFKDFAIFSNNWQKNSNNQTTPNNPRASSLESLKKFSKYWLYKP